MRKIGNKLCIVTIVMLIVLQAMPAYADAKDSFYSYDFFESGVNTTDCIEKEDATSCYMNCQTAEFGGSYCATVYGASDKFYSDSIFMGFYHANEYYYWFTEGTISFMTNCAYENNIPYVYIRATSNENDCFTGLWSPDSVQ